MILPAAVSTARAGALLRGCREERASAVQCKHGDRRLVRTDDLRDGERLGREQ